MSLSARSSLLFLIVALVLSASARAQAVKKADVFDELRRTGAFTEEDLKRLEDGETVIKELERTVKREVALIGAVRIEFPYELARRGLERTVETQRRESAREYRQFGDPPKEADLQGLGFDESDLDDLANCRVGDCKWNLSEKIIESLRAEVDWDSSGAFKKASEVLKRELAGYLAIYSKSGNGSLMIYSDTDLKVGLADEYGALFSSLPFVDRFAGTFGAYARNYPDGRPDGTESVFDWSEVKIGLKPVVMITHTVTYEPGDPAMFSVSKQVFANHYFDSTLGVTALFGFPGNGGRPESYLIFISRSRASALRGRLGGLMRGLIEDQAQGKLEEFLADAKKYTSLASANMGAAEEREALREAEEATFFGSAWFWIASVAVAAALAVLAFLLLRKRAG